MAYSNFSLSKVKADFNLTINERTDLFSQVPPIAPSDYLKLTLKEHLPLVNAINTEKARSELVIMPVLIEVRRHLNYQVSLFSGSEFNVDAAKGLEGRCDFILTRSPEQYYISRPVMTIVEAKNENIKAGLGQCIATMLAAYLFNQQEGTSEDIIYGAVTTGTDWKFLKLVEQMVYIDRDDYYIKEIDQILGILASTLQPEPALAGGNL
ncbi:hypothetical protein [Nodosilinea sp. P-1105]|uniref:hypothetical protein n=1 Tax=Nodosilinea sp. P-1105 TaxID=2546229 RepID=UPI00146BDFD1|nr:hypothetical protein [Nodosilinea sp. P-1105]NMF84148.1 hypothetical protein [Nodosilinea sp. P-1105]